MTDNKYEAIPDNDPFKGWRIHPADTERQKREQRKDALNQRLRRLSDIEKGIPVGLPERKREQRPSLVKPTPPPPPRDPAVSEELLRHIRSQAPHSAGS